MTTITIKSDRKYRRKVMPHHKGVFHAIHDDPVVYSDYTASYHEDGRHKA